MSNFFYDKDIETEVIEEGKNYRKVKAYGGNIMFVEVIFENGGEGAPHTHIHEQASYCTEGEFEYTVGDETKIIGAGDTVYIPSNVLHGCKLLGKRGVLIDIFSPLREDFLRKWGLFYGIYNW